MFSVKLDAVHTVATVFFGLWRITVPDNLRLEGGERDARRPHFFSLPLLFFPLAVGSPPPPLPPCSGYLLPPTPSEKGGEKKEINNVNGLFISDMAPPPPPPPPHCSIAHTASLLLMFFFASHPLIFLPPFRVPLSPARLFSYFPG